MWFSACQGIYVSKKEDMCLLGTPLDMPGPFSACSLEAPDITGSVSDDGRYPQEQVAPLPPPLAAESHTTQEYSLSNVHL